MGADRLRPVWDFADLDETERRFRALLDEEPEAGRAEVLTQLARIEGLRGAFDRADELLDEAEALAGSTPIVGVRISLERGRVRRSAGDVEESVPLFESAFAGAVAVEEWFIAADAAHMVAIAVPDRDAMVAWTERGIELAGAHEGARYWLGPLLNNLGWTYYEAGEYDLALDAFSKALDAREQAGDEPSIQIAHYAVAKALRALGRPQEAIAHLEPAVAWAESQGAPDGWFHEELAEAYAAVGRGAEAGEQAGLALPLLESADPSFADNPDRVARLRSLAAPT